MSYELFYSNGGHVGGFGSKLEAKLVALQRIEGNRTLDWIDIKTSVGGATLARITRDHLYMVIDELGKTVPPSTSENNVAIFTVEAIVVLVGVSDMELNNSEVLHPDVMETLSRDLANGKAVVKVTLDQVYET